MLIFQNTSLALFCKIVDNYGDIGICWRLARQLHTEHGFKVTLWVDDLLSFQHLCPLISLNSNTQYINHITIRHWNSKYKKFVISDIADIVIEFLGCQLPFSYVDIMNIRNPKPIWLNLEGLSAEKWVESYHTLSSPHPFMPLIKYFFFPGFTTKTGGLLRESNLEKKRSIFQNNTNNMRIFLKQFGVTTKEYITQKISLFCYKQAPIHEIFTTWQKSNKKITCLVPEGVAIDEVKKFLDAPAYAGASKRYGRLTVRVLPFLKQSDYDKLLWASDLNFIRGEDSFVRAQYACKPFIWNIYAQQKKLHYIKLKAFLKIYTPKTNSLITFTHAWNNIPSKPVNWIKQWHALNQDIHNIKHKCINWNKNINRNKDLTYNLLNFIQKIQLKNSKENLL